MMSEWMSRVVTDMRGDAGAVVLNALTGAEIAYEDREVALAEYGIAVEFTD